MRRAAGGASVVTAAAFAVAAPALADPPMLLPESGAFSVAPVTVQARPSERGAVFGEDISPELQLDQSDIQAFGVSTITDLLNELEPQTRSERGRTSQGPVILLNGRRISGFSEVSDIPTEAVERVDILPEEEALKYGYSADQKVVNIVLAPHARAETGELGGGGPTDGGQIQGQAEADLFQVAEENRLNFDLKHQGASALTEAARDVVSPPPGAPFAIAGNVVGATPGSEIDPALSALVGHPVTIAGVPATAATAVPTLADFVPTANAPNTTDVRSDRTLAAATQSVSANGVVARALGAQTSLTLNLTLGATKSDATLGLPGVTLDIPAGDPFSPFGQTVTLDRYVAAFGPLRQTVEGWTGHFGTTLNHDHGQWRLSLTSAYDHGETWTQTDAGVDPAPLQAELTALSPMFNPFAPFPPALVRPLPQNRAHSRTDSLNGQFLGNGPLFNLPAGPIEASVKVGDAQSWLASSSSLGGAGQAAVNLGRNDASAQLSLDVPVTSRDKKVLGVLGDMTLNENTAVDWLSDFGTLLTIGYGATWTPVEGLNLNFSETLDHAAPTQAQLGAPLLLTPGTPVFDYVTGQTVQVTTISGGEPSLKADSRNVMNVGVNWRPIASRQLILTVNYTASRINDAIASLPAATSQIEKAFPDHFIRGPGGELTQVDERAVNFTREDQSAISWGLTYIRPIGPQLRPRLGGRSGGPGELSGGARVRGGRLLLSLHHTVILEDRILMRPGGPLLDQLNGAPAGSTGGAARQEIQAQALLSLRGVGVSLNADWKSGTRVRDPSGASAGALNFSDLGLVNLRLFANLEQMPDLVRRWPILNRTRITLSATNLFNARMRVRDADGLTPISYQPAFLDPEGRVVTLSLRKLF